MTLLWVLCTLKLCNINKSCKFMHEIWILEIKHAFFINRCWCISLDCFTPTCNFLGLLHMVVLQLRADHTLFFPIFVELYEWVIFPLMESKLYLAPVKRTKFNINNALTSGNNWSFKLGKLDFNHRNSWRKQRNTLPF